MYKTARNQEKQTELRSVIAALDPTSLQEILLERAKHATLSMAVRVRSILSSQAAIILQSQRGCQTTHHCPLPKKIGEACAPDLYAELAVFWRCEHACFGRGRARMVPPRVFFIFAWNGSFPAWQESY